MAITDACGPHCGIRSNAEGTVTREGHCPCCCQIPVVRVPSMLALPLRRPMCDRKPGDPS